MADFRQNNQRGGYNQFNAAAPRVITAQKIPGNYVDEAEKVINQLPDRPITTTKLRKLFGLFTDLYNDVKRQDEDQLTAAQKQALTTARIRMVYECGREQQAVDAFVRAAKLMEYLKGIGDSRSEFMKFHQYFEALVAYHRFRFGESK